MLYTAPPRTRVPGIRIGTIIERQARLAHDTAASRSHPSAMTTSNIVLDLIEAFRRSKTMFAAVEARHLRRPAARRITRNSTALLDACVALGLLEKQGDAYVNTPDAEKYLRSDSPDTITGYINYSNDALYAMLGHLEDAVREGTPRWKQTFGIEGGIFSGFFRTEEAQARIPEGHARLRTHQFARGGRRRSTSAGFIAWWIWAARAAIWPKPRANATRSFRPQCSICPRSRRLYPGTIAGDFFTDPLPPADLYSAGPHPARLVGRKDARCCWRKIYAALPAGGGLLIAEKLLEPHYVSAHMQSLNMLVAAEGRERSAAEYAALLRTAGFTDVQSRVTGAPVDATLALK